MNSFETAPDSHTEINASHPGGRDVSMDLLRVIASVLVVLIHVASQNWYALAPDSANWLPMNIYDSMARPAVPLFIMLSGAFMLAPEKRFDLRGLWLHRIPRLAGAYILWSLCYALYTQTAAFTSFGELTAVSIVKSAVEGQYHLWFLPVIILLYALLPVLRAPLTGENGKRNCEYMLIIFLGYGVIRATALAFDFPGHVYAQLLADRFSFGAVWSYAGYFLLGFYLYRYSLPRAFKTSVYVLGLCAAPLITAATCAASYTAGAPDERFYTIFSTATLFYAAALFIFFHNIVSKHIFSRTFARFIGFAASCSLGIYLSHVLVLNLLADRAAINTLSLPTAMSVPLLTAVVWTAAFAFTALYKFAVRLLRVPAARRRSFAS